MSNEVKKMKVTIRAGRDAHGIDIFKSEEIEGTRWTKSEGRLVIYNSGVVAEFNEWVSVVVTPSD